MEHKIKIEKTKKRNFKQGQVMLIAIVLFVAISAVMIFGVATQAISRVKLSHETEVSDTTYFLAETAVEDITYRLEKGLSIPMTQTVSLNGGTIDTTFTTTATGKHLVATATIDSEVRKIQADISLGDGVGFHYGMQAGNGGFTLSNSSSITGNAFSSGTIIGSGNYIYGDVISAGSTGLVYGIHATGTVYSHTIGGAQATTIDKDAYYQVKTGTVTVNGTNYPGSADQPVVALPISDTQITEWETDAAAGGTMLSSSCDSYNAGSNTCTITSSKSLGPLKIPFNLLLKTNSGILTVLGHLWITGDLTTQTGPTIRIDPSLGAFNAAIVTDNQSDRLNSGVISIGQTTSFQGSGSSGSYVFLISMNNSAENGGSVNAIDMSQGSSATIAYASHGLISLSQSVGLKEVTAYKITLTNSANITYDHGLPNTLFTGGPSGGYNIFDWREATY